MGQEEILIATVFILGSLLTWSLVVLSILTLDRKIPAKYSSNWMVLYFFNLICALFFAIVQLYFLSWVVNLLTGHGFGYAVGTAAIMYIFGALPIAVISTVIFWKWLRNKI